jgi:hypothetical protein
MSAALHMTLILPDSLVEDENNRETHDHRQETRRYLATVDGREIEFIVDVDEDGPQVAAIGAVKLRQDEAEALTDWALLKLREEWKRARDV